MKILVLNGSPKGNDLSVTMKYVHYIEQLFPEIEFKKIAIGQLLNNMKIQESRLSQIFNELREADGILYSFPIYTPLIPAQLKKFIEILFEKDLTDLKDKYAASLSTSMKFYDIAAHNYIHAISEQLNMNFVGFFSVGTYDFLNFEERKKWYLFMEDFIMTPQEHSTFQGGDELRSIFFCSKKNQKSIILNSI
ncbi:MAG: hypothetical protein BAJALOKI1v1_2210006 [Promethearchaeota archaeon]|nr:MAG: hypothetical protein BAJALOKI1v1_2210006 [Candidatus Lokiarchaeota archaeon]